MKAIRGNKLPSITLVTPSFNQGVFIEETIQSVLKQEYPSLEYIVIDGGSRDRSADIIRKYEVQLFHWESKPDKGQADAIERGFNIGTGEILGWLNSDDLLAPESLLTVGRYFAEHPDSNWVVGGCATIDSQSRLLPGPYRTVRFNLGRRPCFWDLLYAGCGFNQPAVFWRRSLYRSVGSLDTSLYFCFDYDLFLRLARRERAHAISAVIAYFRIHPESKTSTSDHIRVSETHSLHAKYGYYDFPLVTRLSLAWFFKMRRIGANRAAKIAEILGLIRIPPPYPRE